jgi:hypothetical protein
MPAKEVQSLSNDIVVFKTRPSNTTAYDAGDVIGAADTGTAANAGDAIWTFSGVPLRSVLEGVALRVDLTAVTSGMTTFRLHLYSAAPTAILDNAAWDLIAGDRAAYLGYVDIPAPTDLGSTLWSQVDSANKRVVSTSDIMYGMLQTIGGYTPASATVYTVTLRVQAA